MALLAELAAPDAIPLKTAKNRKNVQLACFSADFIGRSADFQSAVSQNCILLAVAMPRDVGAFGRSADCKSATQQIKNLRYARAGVGRLLSGYSARARARLWGAGVSAGHAKGDVIKAFDRF